jgi:hypothetical protein
MSRFGLPVLSSSSSDNVVRLNEAIAVLDIVSTLGIKDRKRTTPPTAVAGEAYVVASGASGAWATHVTHIAFWTGAEWRYVVPKAGVSAYCVEEKCFIVFNGTSWTALADCSFKKNANSSAVTSDVGITWDVTQVDISASRVFAFDAGNPTRIQLNEAGEYKITANVTFNASSTAAWNNMQVRLQTSPDGTTWTDVADAAVRAAVRPTDLADNTCALVCYVSVSAGTFIRLCVNRASGSSTVVVTNNTRIRIEKR